MLNSLLCEPDTVIRTQTHTNILTIEDEMIHSGKELINIVLKSFIVLLLLLLLRFPFFEQIFWHIILIIRHFTLVLFVDLLLNDSYVHQL